MNSATRPPLDPRRAEEIVEELLARAPGYLPGWRPSQRGSDAALIWVFARYLEAVLQRLDQAPEKNLLAFLDLLGARLTPAQPARAVVIFRLAEKAAATFVEAGSRVVAQLPPGSSEQIVFETESRAGLMAGGLKQVVSLWAGRDQYADHSSALTEKDSFTLFERRALRDTPHHLYIAHDTLLALAGQARVKVELELTQTSSETLDLAWEYWDGKQWQGFKDMHPSCGQGDSQPLDSTGGLQGSGRILLLSDCADSKPTTINGTEAYWIRAVLREPLPPDPARILPLVENLRLSTEIVHPIVPDPLPAFGLAGSQGRTETTPSLLQSLTSAQAGQNGHFSGLLPDMALFGSAELDLTQTFYPLGLAPKPGDAFYLASEEAFSKPGAEVTVLVTTAQTPAHEFEIDESSPLEPEFVWEYWDGRRWTDLPVTELASDDQARPPASMEGDGLFRFRVPDDLSRTSVDERESLWIRGRLVSGGYGFTASVTWNEGGTNAGSNSFTYVITQPPAVAGLQLGYSWQHGPFSAEHVLAYNDFQYVDNTEEALWPGRAFAPFGQVRDVSPAVYLGFDQPFPVEYVSVYFDLVEQPGETRGPALVWEYWDGFSWAQLSVQDETGNLRVPGLISFAGPGDNRELARFDAKLYWLRGRLKDDGPPGSPLVEAIYPNAARAAHLQTIVDDPLGTSTREPDQVFFFRQVPVLPEEQVEVRELAGARARVEWRTLAMDILGQEYAVVQEIEDRLKSEGTASDLQFGPLRLRRDRNKQVTEAWVRWEARDNLFFSAPTDRHYVLEHSRGRVRFGDGVQGRVPPLGGAIQARRYRTGGGRRGNVPAGSLSQLLAGVSGVEAVFNPRPAEGGADGETLEALARRGPRTLRRRGRLISGEDYETLAREASPAVAVARVLPGRDPHGIERPGWVTLVVIPDTDDPRPWPSFGLREQVRKHLEAQGAADLVAASRIYVTGPRYQPVDVSATLVPRDPTRAGAVEQSARAALARFLHPLRGGPEEGGWEPGRSLYLSDVASLLERVPGVDYTEELALLVDGGLQGERVRVPAGHVLAAGHFTLRVETGS